MIKAPIPFAISAIDEVSNISPCLTPSFFVCFKKCKFKSRLNPVIAVLQEICKKCITLEAMKKKYSHCKNIILPNMFGHFF